MSDEELVRIEADHVATDTDPRHLSWDELCMQVSEIHGDRGRLIEEVRRLRCALADERRRT